MPWNAASFHKHNHALTPEQAGHASRIANAILRRSGNEGTAIATANKLVRRDDGGYVADTSDDTSLHPSVATANPMTQGMIQRYSSMPTERLQELSVMLGGSPQSQIVQRVLQQRRMTPAQPAAPQQGYDSGGSLLGGQYRQRFDDPDDPDDGYEQLPGVTTRPSKPWGLNREEEARRTARPPPKHWTDLNPRAQSVDNSVDPRGEVNLTPPDSYAYRMKGRAIIVPPGRDNSDRGIYASPDRADDMDLAGGGIVQGRADGGMESMSEGSPWWTRAQAHQGGQGFLHGITPGRADAINAAAPGGSYVIPAEVVAGLGEGNSLAGARAVEEMLRTGPHGTPMPRAGAHRGPPAPPRAFAEATGGYVPKATKMRGGFKVFRSGGTPGDGNQPVMLSDGEYVLRPEDVQRFGGGDHAKGVKWWDRWVMHEHRKHIAKLKKYPGPVKEGED